ncbi:hypothetical protein AB0941_41250 [Streptomyces sp. NPDC013433]|uniref:hypothetical protein n=1 Tax=Streptomyces sp. NPDC013433 TaxID=3155604 RepID=UPI0034511281
MGLTDMPPGTATLVPGTSLRGAYDSACQVLGDRLLRPMPFKIALWALDTYIGAERKAVYLLGANALQVLYVGSTGRGKGCVRARVREHVRDPRKADVSWVLILPLTDDADEKAAEGDVGRHLGKPLLTMRLPRLR